MSGLRERIARLRSSAARSAAEERPVRESAGAEKDTLGGEEALAAGFVRIGAEIVHSEWGAFLLRRREYPLSYRHGRYALGELAEAAPRLAPMADRPGRLRAAARGPAPEVAAQSLLFLDTETTGLGVGAGNVPFMIGLGYLDGGRFVVEQTMARHPGEERAMLAFVLTRLTRCTHLGTFNGRSFDWPVLAGRFILNGWRPTGEEPGHLDFLHPSRALWRNTLDSCRLSRIEEARLGVERGDDLPGSLAPALYFRYLQDGDAEPLAGVFLHNERDVLTLAALAIHFGRLLHESPAEPAELPEEPEELFRTALWLDRHGRSGKADRLLRELAARARSGGDGAGAGFRWRMAAAVRWKRRGRYDEAVPLWEEAADRAERAALPPIEAHVELAMFYEHRARDYARALHYAEEALRLSEKRPLAAGGAKRREEREALRRRIERIRAKIRRGAAAVPVPGEPRRSARSAAGSARQAGGCGQIEWIDPDETAERGNRTVDDGI